MPDKKPTIQLKHVTLSRGHHSLWKGLDLDVSPGEFIAVLGPNGAGKTTLLKLLLGLIAPTHGTVSILSEQAHRGNKHIGYIPQQKSFDTDLPIRGRDLVQLGATGFRYGFDKQNPLVDHHITEAIEAVGATGYANASLGQLSGGQQQRLRVAQALVGKPEILLCDEPLSSLDLASQRNITDLINDYRNNNQASVVFVTHDINPVLPYVDRILYLANGHWAVDTPDVVLQADVLSGLYGAEIEVIKAKDRILVLDTGSAATPNGHHGSTQ